MEKNKGGRPTDYSKELADKICLRLMEGESLRSICDDDDMPHRSTIHQWVNDKPEFSDQYLRARDIQAQTLFDECLDIADDGRNDWMTKTGRDGKEYEVVNHEVIQRSKLRVDTRFQMAKLLAPKLYGERKQVDHTSSDKSMAVNRELTEEELKSEFKRRGLSMNMFDES